MDTKKITPAYIEGLALDARVSLTKVLEKAGVSRGTYYRWRRKEGGMLPLTKVRLVDAVDAINREKTQ